jgi:tetratricopeptide (TPR) repeat protein
MRKKRRASISLFALASLIWISSPVRAQEASGADGKEFAAGWENANPRFLKGRDYFVKKEFDKAEAEFKTCLEILPEHSDALFFLARLDYRRGDFARALAIIEKAEASHAAFAGSDGIIESQRRRALLDKRKKMEQEVAFMEDTFYAADCRTDQEMLKLPESIEALRRKLNEPFRTEARPLPADYSYVHGNILFKLNRPQEAGHQYLKAIESDARHTGAYNNLINLCYMARDYGDALKYIDQAETSGVALNPRLKQAVLQVAKK